MIIRNSVRQLGRMKGRAVLFLLLLTVASGLCSLGRSFWLRNQGNIAAYTDTFMTVGTVRQTADRMQESKSWDAQTGWKIYNRPVYERYLPISVLDFEGADYLSGPEQRILYGAYMPEYELYDDLDVNIGCVIEASPLEDVVPDHPVKLQVKKVLWSPPGLREGDIIKFCSHYDPVPEMLHADKTYIMELVYATGHESEKQFDEMSVMEYVPYGWIASTQSRADGTKVPDDITDGHFYDEVTDGFYETARGKRWLNLIESWERRRHIFPVTGTNNIYLMMAFYSGNAYITEGRGFTEEEYSQGGKVCLISERFSAQTGLGVGDELRLPLMYAEHGVPAGMEFTRGAGGYGELLNAKGEIYPVFEDSVYTVAGIYGGVYGIFDEYGMGDREIVIPARSVKNSDEDNIVMVRPMRDGATSFQIANGTVEEYLEKWNRLGIDNVEITFYDRGYGELEANIKNMRQIARLLIVMGMAMVCIVLGYFSWLFIVRQKERTAIERSLGLKKGQSFLSLFSGIFLLILTGGVCGCLAGGALSGHLSKDTKAVNYFDTSYGNSAAVVMENISQEELAEEVPLLPAAMETALAVLAAGSVIAGAGIAMNLRQEPMEMLGGRRE